MSNDFDDKSRMSVRMHGNSHDETESGPASVALRNALIVAIGIACLALVMMSSVATYIARVSPQTLLTVYPQHPVAVLNAAARQMAEVERSRERANAKRDASAAGVTRFVARDPEDIDLSHSEGAKSVVGSIGAEAWDKALRARVAAAVGREPLNVTGLELLGQAADVAGETKRARASMSMAARLSLRATAAHFWLLRHGYQRRDYKAVLAHADVLLRTRPQLNERIVPYLAWVGDQRSGRDELVKLLAGNPPWRRAFFGGLVNSMSDARTPMFLFVELAVAGAPATGFEKGVYIDFLLKRGLYDLAYTAWLQLLPAADLADAAFLYNGGFEKPLAGVAFNWRIRGGKGVSVGVVSGAPQDGGRALRVTLKHGRVELGQVSQWIRLAPGSYVFKGRYRGTVTGRRGLVWRVRCVQAGAPLAASDMVLGDWKTWTEFSFNLSVPKTDCGAQVVQLELDARSASEQLVRGDVLFDELMIEVASTKS